MLKISLFINALFSASTASLMLIAPSFLQAHIPLPHWFWITIGIGLAGFAVTLALTARDETKMHLLSPWIIGADSVWVIGSFLGFLFFFNQISILGAVMVFGVNMMVGLLALMQYLGFRNLQHGYGA